jgi:hypothetical protein
MRTNLEKRDCARFYYEAPVVIEQCNTARYYEARMYNYSLHGIYIESDLGLAPGDQVNLWISGSPENTLPGIEHAEVRWCEEICGAVVLYNYGCGIKYRRPADQDAFSRNFRIIQGGKDFDRTGK